MAKDVGMAIRKSIVVSFLPRLVAFLGFHPYMVVHFFKRIFVTWFFGGRNFACRCVVINHD